MMQSREHNMIVSVTALFFLFDNIQPLYFSGLIWSSSSPKVQINDQKIRLSVLWLSLIYL